LAQHFLLRFFLGRGGLCGCLLLALGIGLPLGHAALHGAGDRSGAGTLAGVTSYSPNGGASGSASRGPEDTSALHLLSVRSCLLLGGLLFFCTQPLRGPSLRVNPGPLLGHPVAVRLVFQLLICNLVILRKCEQTYALGR
jgi:hypothetical protein